MANIQTRILVGDLPIATKLLHWGAGPALRGSVAAASDVARLVIRSRQLFVLSFPDRRRKLCARRKCPGTMFHVTDTSIQGRGSDSEDAGDLADTFCFPDSRPLSTDTTMQIQTIIAATESPRPIRSGVLTARRKATSLRPSGQSIRIKPKSGEGWTVSRDP